MLGKDSKDLSGKSRLWWLSHSEKDNVTTALPVLPVPKGDNWAAVAQEEIVVSEQLWVACSLCSSDPESRYMEISEVSCIVAEFAGAGAGWLNLRYESKTIPNLLIKLCSHCEYIGGCKAPPPACANPRF